MVFAISMSMQVEKANSIENNIVGFFSRYGQIALISLIMVVVGLMIMPMEPSLLDILLALNITGALLVLMMAISITHPMKLASFPSLLLLCTLFRLGLNISSTRLILSRGDAGEIIRTFGHFVTSGNLIVGIIIFLVLMIVQFIVVSKGAERVAEVAARFTLDALPGKQMSIDADLRAGMISSEEAALRRNGLIKESKLYGSMDGAMKFVKGDAIAGFVITFINIVAGLIMGVFQRGLSIDVAAKQYTILTVGDGLVSQIPALLVSIAAGFIVTRVADDKNNQSLGNEIGQQVFVQPFTVLIVSVMSLFLGFVPGFPFILFLFIAISLAVLAFVIIWQKKQYYLQRDSVESYLLDTDYEGCELGYARPLLLELSQKLYAEFLRDESWRACFNDLFPKIQTKISQRLGVSIPDLRITVNSDLNSNRYDIKIYEIPVEEGFLSIESCLVRDEDLGLEEILLKHLAKIIIKHASEFIGIQEVKDILTNVENHHPELVREVVPRLVTVQKFTDIIKRLVEEGVSVKDFRIILETLTVVHPEDKSTVDLTELVRIGLKRQITYKHTGNSGRLDCFGLDPEIEDEVCQGIKKSGQDYYLTLPPEKLESIKEAVSLTYQNHQTIPRRTVLLTQPEVRRYVRKIIETEMPDVSVLSYQELEPHVVIEQRDTISWGMA